MSTEPAPPFEQLVSADKIVHEPARLAVLTALSACASADFVFLQRLTGLQSGNLSQHLAKLEQAGLIALSKAFNGKYPQTTVRITDDGRAAVEEHWNRLAAMRKAADSWPR
ncbi:MAG: ArsR family transcriptional regulator [Acidobacteria bacterium RIFCSPLOWO2_12_FULL_66_21]|nr:MAG: ArsR family transcriptional regulator [Acidobacteria bacterium RIFCSPLOWO2_12_FULL_66_21]